MRGQEVILLNFPISHFLKSLAHSALSWLKKTLHSLGQWGVNLQNSRSTIHQIVKTNKVCSDTVVFKYFTTGTVKNITGEVFSNVLKQKHPTFQILFIEGAFISVWAAGWQCAWWIKGLSLYGSMTQFRIDRTILLCLDMLINCQIILLN